MQEREVTNGMLQKSADWCHIVTGLEIRVFGRDSRTSGKTGFSENKTQESSGDKKTRPLVNSRGSRGKRVEEVGERKEVGKKDR